MSKTATRNDDLAISEYADELDAAAEDATDLEREDAIRVLAAAARGEKAPKAVRDRVHRRYGGQ